MHKPKSALANILTMRKLKELNDPPSLPQHKKSFKMPSMRPPMPKGKR